MNHRRRSIKANEWIKPVKVLYEGNESKDWEELTCSNEPLLGEVSWW